MYFKKEKAYLIASYVRLSREDGDKVESDSIHNQRELICDFVKKHDDLKLVEEYIDDGYSGTNFDRPAFMRMIEDAKRKKIDCIIVKDLSRLGRNYIETGKYIEKIFPFMGIRFIAINDHYDSADEESDADHIIIPFKNLINDAYCKDISIKIRSQLDVKRKSGKFIGSFAGYGYLKDPKDKNHLVVDEYAAQIVQMVFRLKLDGVSSQRITEKLTEMGALPPLEYKRMLGMNFNSGFRSGSNPKWSVVAVNRILRNELYTGNMVQGKRKKISYKVKQSRAVNEADWIRVAGTHEAIIPTEEFDQVQRVMLMDTRTAPDAEKIYLFSGFLRCGDCGQNMVKRCTTKDGKKYHYYHCSTYKSGNGCTAHLISEKHLTDIVLEAIRKQVEVLVRAEAVLGQIQLLPQERFGVKEVKAQIATLSAEVERYQELKTRLYQDMQDGVVDRGEFKAINERFTEKIRSAQQAQNKLEVKLENLLKTETELQPWLEEFKSYRNIQHLERKVLVLLIDHIDVYGKDRIEIHFQFEDEIQQMIQNLEYYEAHKFQNGKVSV